MNRRIPIRIVRFARSTKLVEQWARSGGARLTLGFSKKIENHKHAVALNFVHYNFVRIHQTFRVTPAMEAGLTDHVWEFEEILALLK